MPRVLVQVSLEVFFPVTLPCPLPYASQDHGDLEEQEEVVAGSSAEGVMVVFPLLFPGGNVYNALLCFLVRTTQQSILKVLIFLQNDVQGPW